MYSKFLNIFLWTRSRVGAESKTKIAEIFRKIPFWIFSSLILAWLAQVRKTKIGGRDNLGICVQSGPGVGEEGNKFNRPWWFYKSIGYNGIKVACVLFFSWIYGGWFTNKLALKMTTYVYMHFIYLCSLFLGTAWCSQYPNKVCRWESVEMDVFGFAPFAKFLICVPARSANFWLLTSKVLRPNMYKSR